MYFGMQFRKKISRRWFLVYFFYLFEKGAIEDPSLFYFEQRCIPFRVEVFLLQPLVSLPRTFIWYSNRPQTSTSITCPPFALGGFFFYYYYFARKKNSKLAPHLYNMRSGPKPYLLLHKGLFFVYTRIQVSLKKKKKKRVLKNLNITLKKKKKNLKHCKHKTYCCNAPRHSFEVY